MWYRKTSLSSRFTPLSSGGPLRQAVTKPFSPLTSVYRPVGLAVGCDDGITVFVGKAEGERLGDLVGYFDGLADGDRDGRAEGWEDGAKLKEGLEEGIGDIVGAQDVSPLPLPHFFECFPDTPLGYGSASTRAAQFPIS